MDIDSLNKSICDDFKAGRKSIFRVSFEVFGGEDAAKIREELAASARPLPYLRIASLFQEFYDYANGRNYRDCWEANNRRVDIGSIWQQVYGVPVTQYDVKARAWIISGECRGAASDIWRVIKACASKKSEDGADHFDPASYANDNPPRQLKIILNDYQSGGIDGTEFVSFIEAYNRKQETQDEWLCKLVDVAKKHFPKDADFTAGYYLKWDGNGEESARLILGVDNVHGRKTGRLTIDGKYSHVTISSGFKALELPPTDADSYKVSYCGYEEQFASSPVGVYCRYVYGRNPRRNWWRKIQQGGGFPNYRDELLICLPAGYVSTPNWQSAGIEVDVPQTTCVYCAGKRYILYYCRILSRPRKGVLADICGMKTVFAGESPSLKMSTDPAEGISAEDAVVVDESTRISVLCVPDGVSCKWEINGETIAKTGTELEIPLTGEYPCEKRIAVTLRNDRGRICRKLAINLFYVPREIVTLIRAGISLPPGWSLDDEKDSERYIENRVSQKRGVLLSSPNNIILPVLVSDTSLAWWFECDSNSHVVTGEYKEVGQFPRFSDLDECYLCVPEDLKDRHLELSGRKYPMEDYPSLDGVVRIPLESLFAECEQYEFKYNGKVSELTLKLGGETVCDVAALPKKPVLCRHADTEDIGVFLPNRVHGGKDGFVALVYSDSITIDEVYSLPLVLASKELNWKKDEGDRFVSLQEKLSDFCEKKPKCDVFVVLVKEDNWDEYSCMLCNPFFLKDGVEAKLLYVQKTDRVYTEDESIAIKHLRSLWEAELDALSPKHPMRHTRFVEFAGRIKYEDCVSHWDKAKCAPAQWKQVCRVMLDSGYNPLMEPKWFNQDLTGLIAASNRMSVLRVLLDNRDGRADSTMEEGDGLCAALVAKRLIDSYSSLIPTGVLAKLMNREQTILSAKSLARLGIYGIFMDPYRTTYRHLLKKADGGEMQFSGSGGEETIKRVPSSGVWKRTDSRRKKLAFVGFAFSETDNGPEKFFAAKAKNIDAEEDNLLNDVVSTDDFDLLLSKGRDLSGAMRTAWTAKLFEESFEVFGSKGFCDLAIVHMIALIITLQSIITSEKGSAPINHDERIYEIVLRVVRKLFIEKFSNGNDTPWRELMRTIVGYLGIYSYLGIDVKSIENNKIEEI